MTDSEKAKRLEEFMPVIKRVAYRVAKDTYIVERDDLEQELVLFVLGRPTLPTPEEAKGKFSMQSFLTRVAKMYAFEQKQQHYLIDPNVSYEVADIKVILETHFNRDHWTAITEGESVEDKIAAHSDVAWSLNQLKPDDKAFVATCYTSEKRPASGTKEYRRLRDIVIKVCNMLNHYTRADEGNGVGRRKVISNSQADFIIHTHTDGDGFNFANSRILR